MRLKEIIDDESLVGPRWLQSVEKRQFDAEVGNALRAITRPITRLTGHVLHQQYGYQFFPSIRDTGEYHDDGSAIEVPILKMQTMYAKDIPWTPGVQEVMPMLPLAWLARYFMLDQLIELEHVSNDPARPGKLSIAGPRYLVHPERIHMMQLSQEYGEYDLYKAWLPCYRGMPKGVLDVASSLPEECTQGTMPFYRERMKRHIWWYDNASPRTDISLLEGVVSLGRHRLDTITEAVKPQIDLWDAVAHTIPTT